MARIPQSRNVLLVFRDQTHHTNKRLNIPARGRVIDLVCDRLSKEEADDLVGILENGKWIY